MNKITHMCLSVRGALNWSKAEMKRMAPSIKVDGKQLKTADEVKNFLLNELSEGHEVLPFGDCDNFDWKTGCKGHSKQEEGNAMTDPNACPCCGLTVIHTGGCIQCPDQACGWSKCS